MLHVLHYAEQRPYHRIVQHPAGTDIGIVQHDIEASLQGPLRKEVHRYPAELEEQGRIGIESHAHPQ